MRYKLSILIALSLCPPLIAVRSYTVNFASGNYFDSSSTAVWNRVRERFHVPFIVDRGEGPARSLHSPRAEDDAVAMGSGTDGVFDSTTYADFDVNEGATPTQITLDTTRVYEFTTFTLNSGVTLTGTGGSPLRIRVQGNAEIAGTIDVSGQAGGAIDADFANATTGGTSCCGGGAGGTGGSNAGAAQPGVTPATDLTTGRGLAGAASAGAGIGSGGGGGGGFDSTGGANGVTPAGGGAGGAEGASFGDAFLSTLTGGAGGGGGGAYLLGGGADRSAGGAGGGGGGAIFLSVGGNVTIASTGNLLARGGNGGGTASGVLLAGGGGAGAGGAVVIFVGGTLINNGLIDASGGTGGTTPATGNGGNGNDGRTRIVTTSAAVWTGTGSETPLPNMSPLGRTFYSTQSYTLLSSIIDTGTDRLEYLSVDKTDSTPLGSTVTYELAGSSDNFVTDTTGFVPLTQLASLANKRYFRFRVTLQSGDRSVTPEVTALQINIVDDIDTFRFRTASCGHVGERTDPLAPFWSLCFITFLLLVPIPLGRKLGGKIHA